MEIEPKLARKVNRFRHELFKIYRVQRFILAEVCLILLAAFLVPIFELPFFESKIKNFGDGLWWAIITITSVGYGDKVPLSVEGKIIGGILAISGILVFGIVISMFALYFGRKKEEFYEKRSFYRQDLILKEIEELRKEVEFLVKNN